MTGLEAPVYDIESGLMMCLSPYSTVQTEPSMFAQHY